MRGENKRHWEDQRLIISVEISFVNERERAGLLLRSDRNTKSFIIHHLRLCCHSADSMSVDVQPVATRAEQQSWTLAIRFRHPQQAALSHGCGFLSHRTSERRLEFHMQSCTFSLLCVWNFLLFMKINEWDATPKAQLWHHLCTRSPGAFICKSAVLRQRNGQSLEASYTKTCCSYQLMTEFFKH